MSRPKPQVRGASTFPSVVGSVPGEAASCGELFSPGFWGQAQQNLEGLGEMGRAQVSREK